MRRRFRPNLLGKSQGSCPFIFFNPPARSKRHALTSLRPQALILSSYHEQLLSILQELLDNQKFLLARQFSLKVIRTSCPIMLAIKSASQIATPQVRICAGPYADPRSNSAFIWFYLAQDANKTLRASAPEYVKSTQNWRIDTHANTRRPEKVQNSMKIFSNKTALFATNYVRSAKNRIKRYHKRNYLLSAVAPESVAASCKLL